jgi:N-acetyl sugar amidotransferase
MFQFHEGTTIIMNRIDIRRTQILRVCTKTVMDGSDPDIKFDEQGVCNYWHEFCALNATLPSAQERELKLHAIIAQMKRAGRRKPYDCVIGLSGGVDSSYLAYVAKKMDLRPLLVHFDNGWNNEVAISNIQNIVSATGFDLQTFVMDWPEFRDLQRAYFKASVLDLEVPTDHMIFGALYRTAAKNRISYILSGHNIVTEWLLPKSWYYSKFDLTNILGIHKAFGERPLKRLPRLGVWHYAWYQLVLGIRDVKLLDLVFYNKSEAKQVLQQEFGWQDYGGKHHESIFTRFYQGYILPRKFGIDKRKAHLSNLILSGQLTRDEALRELQAPPYDEALQQQDKAYVAKKLGFALEEFEELLTRPNRSHAEFGSDQRQRQAYFALARALSPISRLLKRARRSA